MAYYINQEYVPQVERLHGPMLGDHVNVEEQEPVEVDRPCVPMAAYDLVEVLDHQGFADGRFASSVDEDLHCAICLNVLNLPVQCQKNEHHFCTPCITRHLRDFLECPCCKEELSVETLKKPARYLTKVLSQLRIRCDYESRGCPEFVELEGLKNHVAVCGFAPVNCSNEGCGKVINKLDRVRHETEICEFRRAKCHDCAELKEEIGRLKHRLKREIGDLKEELKEEVGGIKVELDNLKQELKKGLEDDMDELKTKVGDMKILLEELKKQMCSKMVDENKEFEISKPKKYSSAIPFRSNASPSGNIFVDVLHENKTAEKKIKTPIKTRENIGT